MEALITLGCLPVEQRHFPPDARTVTEMLREKIAGCVAVVHLVGHRFGAEPSARSQAQRRRSYTQLEYDIAIELGKPVYVFILESSYPVDSSRTPPEPVELQELQLQHRTALLGGEVVYTVLRSPEELRNRLRELQVHVEQLERELAAERASRRRWRTAAALVLLTALSALAAIAWGVRRLQRQHLETRQELYELALRQSNADVSALHLPLPERRERALEERAAELNVQPSVLRAQLTAWSQRVDADSSASRWDRALSDFHRGRFADAAQSAIAEATELQERQVDAWTLAGQAEMEGGRFLAAQRCFESALQAAGPGADPKTRVGLLLRAANAMLAGGESLRAPALITEAQALSEQLGAGDSADAARIALATGRNWLLLGNAYAAESPLRRAVSIEERSGRAATRQLAAMRRALGEALYGLGRFDEAELELLRAATIDQAPSSGADAIDAVEDELALASLATTREDFLRAEHHAASAVAIAEARLGPDHVTASDALLSLAAARHQLARPAEALVEYRRALEIRRRNAGETHPNTLAAGLLCAAALIQSGELASAEALCESTGSIIEREYPAASRLGFLARAVRSGLDLAKGSYDAAVARHWRALAEFGVDQFGLDGAILELSALSKVQREAEHWDDAEIALRAALEISATGGRSSFAELCELGQLLELRYRFDEAATCFALALREGEKRLGPMDSRLAACHSGLARRGYWLAPITVLEHAEAGLRIRERQLGSRRPELATDLRLVAGALVKLGRGGDAAAALQRALDLERQLSPFDARAFSEHSAHLGRVLLASDCAAQARDAMNDAVAVLVQSGETVGELVLEVRRVLASSCVALGEAEQAQQDLKSAVAASEGAAAWSSISAAQADRAAILDELGRSEEAREEYRRAARSLRRADVTFFDRQTIGGYYLRAGLPADAAVWLRRAYLEMERVVGPEYYQGGIALAELGRALRTSGRATQAATVLERSICVLQRALQPGDSDYERIAAAIAEHRECCVQLGVDSAEVELRLEQARASNAGLEPFGAQLSALF